MQRITSAILITALTGSSVAHAASDMGLTLHEGPRASASHGGMGAQASVTVRLGDRRIVRGSEKVTLGIAAGPMLAIPSRNAVSAQKSGVAGLAALSIKPGYSASLSIAGQPALQTYTRLGAADAEAQPDGTTKQKKKQSAGDKIAWVAAVAGGVMVVLIGVAAIALSTYCYECGD